MNEILLFGGGGHCRSVIDVIEQEGKYKIAGIIDDLKDKGSAVLGYEVVGRDGDINEMSEKYRYAIVTVGQIQSAEVRIKLYSKLKYAGFKLPVVVSPRAYVSKHAEIGEGTVVMHDVLINAGVRIGSNCIINTKALIEHDSVIGNHTHVSTGGIVNGSVVVNDEVFLGSNATTKESTVIDKGRFIRAGSVVK